MRDWETFAIRELQAARRDRAQGNEGRARVRARRVAGAIARAYLRQQGYPDPGPNVLDGLQALEALPDLPPAVRQAVHHLRMKVDTDFRLPPGVDLIAEVITLGQELFGVTLDLDGPTAPSGDTPPPASN